MAICALLLAAFAGRAAGQTQPPADAAAPPAETSAAPQTACSPDDDRFPEDCKKAASLESAYVSVLDANMRDIDRLLKGKVCQIARIGGELDRIIEALNKWIDAELVYHKEWVDSEQKRVDGEMKTLSSMELEQQDAKQLLDDETKDHEELVKKRDVLAQNPKRTIEIIKDLDLLARDIQDSQDRLTAAEKRFGDVSEQVTEMHARLTGKLIDMRQQYNRVKAYGLEWNSYFEDKRKAAQAICDPKHPGGTRTPLPGSKRAPQPNP